MTFSARSPMAKKPFAIGERPGGSKVRRASFLSGDDAWNSLDNVYTHRRSDSQLGAVKKAEFQRDHPFVAGFLQCCGQFNLDEVGIQTLIVEASGVDPTIKQAFTRFLGNDLMEKMAGMWGDMFRNAGRAASGALGTIAGGTGMALAGTGEAINKGLSLFGKNAPQIPHTQTAWDASQGLAGAGVSDLKNSLGMGASGLQGTRNVAPSQTGGFLEATRNQPDVSPGVRATSKALETTGDLAWGGALTGPLARGASMAGSSRALAPLANAASKIPGVAPVGRAVQAFGTAAGSPAGQVLRNSAPTAAKTIGSGLALNEAAGVGTNLAEGQPALAGTLTGAVTGMDQPPVPPAEPEAPPPDAAPAATATPAAPAEPLQLKPGYGQEGGQIGPPDMGEAAQQKTMGGVLDNIEQVSPEQAVQQGLIKPEQTGDFQQIQQMTQSLKQLREGASPEQLGPMMQEAQAEIANPESPTAQKATGGIMEQLGTTWDKARELWNGLSDGEKFLLGLGLSLGAVSLISGFAGERGPMTWVLGALGLGTAAGAAAHGGLLGEGPKGLLQGAEDYVTGLFGESNKPAPPPLSASPAPEATPEAVPSPAPAAPATPPPTAGTTASGGATATTPTVNSIMADNAVSPAEAQQVMKNPALRQQALNDPRAPSIVRMAMQSDPAFAKNMKALKGAPASVAMQILTAPEGQPVRTIGGTYPGAGLPPADAQKLYDLAQAV